MALSDNSMIGTLLRLRGNGRAAVYTEPMWGLSMQLVLPYASVFMLALGVHTGDSTIWVDSGLAFEHEPKLAIPANSRPSTDWGHPGGALLGGSTSPCGRLEPGRGVAL